MSKTLQGHHTKLNKKTCYHTGLNPFMATLKPQSKGPSYSNTVIGTLAVDGWAVTFRTARMDWAEPQPAQAHPRYAKCNSPPINGQCTKVWHYNCFWSLKG